MIVTITDNYRHRGIEIIQDFTGYREVNVKHCDPEMVGAEPNSCIDNSKALAEYGDIQSVKGFYTRDGKVGLFHYWNYCNETDTYWDSTPNTDKMRYFINEAAE